MDGPGYISFSGGALPQNSRVPLDRVIVLPNWIASGPRASSSDGLPLDPGSAPDLQDAKFPAIERRADGFTLPSGCWERILGTARLPTVEGVPEPSSQGGGFSYFSGKRTRGVRLTLSGGLVQGAIVGVFSWAYDPGVG